LRLPVDNYSQKTPKNQFKTKIRQKKIKGQATTPNKEKRETGFDF
jgi:hypothetical protein